MSAPWKSVVVIAVLCAAVGPAADPPKPYQLPLTTFEVLALVHTEPSDDAVIRKLKDSGTHFAPGAPELRQLRQLGVSDRILMAVTAEPQPIVQATFTTPTPPAKSGRPVGTWVREVGCMRIIMKFTEDRMTVTANVPSPDGDVVMTADADYSINPEGLMFGVISGIDADIAEAATELQMMTGHTFSVRCRVDGTTMTVKDLKAFGSGLNKGETGDDFAMAMQMACGRYTRDDSAKPVTPKKAKPNTEKASFGAGPFMQSTFPSPVPHAQPPIAHNPYGTVGVVPTMLQPVPSFTPPPMMAPPPPPLPGNVVQAGWTVYPNPQARLGDPVPPPPMIAPPAPPSRLIGAWIREMDGMQVIAKFTEKRAYFTLNVAMLDGKHEHRFMVRAEADYAVGPDGTVFGVVTGTDFTPPKGDASRDMLSELRQLAELNGSPFCFRFRLDEGNLNLRDVRCGEFAGHDFAVHNPEAMVMLGRYKPLSNQEPTPPKPVKLKTNNTCPNCSPPLERIGIDFNRPETLPTPHYLQHYPQYFPPDPAFPLQRELDAMIRVPEVAPAPRPVRGRESR